MIPKLELLKYLWAFTRQELRLVAAGSLCIVLASAVQLSIPVGAKQLIDVSEVDATPSRIIRDCTLVVVAVVVFHIVSFVGHCFAHNATLKISHAMMREALKAICSMEWESIAQYNPAVLTHTITSASKVSAETVASLITELIASCITAVGILCVVLLISWELTLFFACVVALSQGVTHLYASAFHAPSAAVHAQNEGKLSALLNNAAQRSACIRIFNASEFFMAKCVGHCDAAFASGAQLNAQIHLHGAISSALTNSMFVSMVGIAVYLKSSGRLSLVDIGLFFFYMKQLLDRIVTVAGEARRLTTMLGKAEPFFELVRMAAATALASSSSSSSVAPDTQLLRRRGVVCKKSEGRVGLSDAAFTYRSALNGEGGGDDGDDQPMSPAGRVEGATIAVERGELVCLFGPSGCGKSTILKMLAGLLHPHRGAVETCEPVALLEQAPSIVLGSIRENIALGRRDASQSEIEAAARRAGCHAFIAMLPAGYGTVIDNVDQAQFSGGQLQRICLARVFLTHARLILLDEPTTGLDAAAAKTVLDSAIELKNEGRTVIFASHDDAVVRIADRCIPLMPPK